MKHAFSVTNSNVIVTNLNQHYKPSLFPLIRIILWGLISVAIFIITGLVFYKVLYPEGTLFDVVSLGAVFATLGSTLVSIASLLCNKYYEEFLGCIEVFQNELVTQDINFNWLFLRKQGILSKSRGKCITYKSNNPKVKFEIGGSGLTIEVPVQKKNFYESELLKKILSMKMTKKAYVQYLQTNAESIMESGLYMWECVYHILCSALFYRLFCDLVVIGTLFFVIGLIVTILYPIIF